LRDSLNDKLLFTMTVRWTIKRVFCHPVMRMP